MPNNYLYNGKELNHEGFSDGTGLDWYDYGFRNYDPQLGRFTEQDPLTDNFATVTPYQYGLNDPVANIDEDGLSPMNLLCPLTSGFAIFVQRIGEVASQIASSPLTRALSYSVHGLSVADLVGNTLVMNDKLNNFFIAPEVGGGANAKTDNGNSEGVNDETNLTPGPPTEWLKKIIQFLGWFSQSNDPQTRSEYAERNAELNNLVNQNIQAQKKLDKYSSYIPVLGGAVKMSEGMQDDKPLEIMGGMGSVGFDLFGGEVLNGLGRGITVLGSYNEVTGGYVGLAKELGANFFEIPQSIWEKMTPTEQWSANVKFLDIAIARGDQIILSNSAFEAKAGTSFYKELKYLYLKGYKAASNGMSLIKP